MKYYLLIRTVVARLTLNLLIEPSENESNKTFHNKFAVNTESEWASKVGKRILEKGGNAVDAAISACLCIGVVNSFSSGIGGGGFMLIRQKKQKKDQFDFLDFREVAPKGISDAHFKDNPEYSKTTGLSVAVPGEILGLFEAHKKYGKLDWKVLFEDPIKLAYGFKASSKLIEKLNKNKNYVLDDPGLRETFTKNGEIVKEGDLIKRTNLAKTLEVLSRDPLSFYKGDLGDKIVKFLKRNQGVIEKRDLEKYKVVKTPVIQSTFYDYKVITTNLPTSGLFVVEALKILEKINIRDLKYFINNENSFRMYHIIIETFKFIMSERGRLGDPSFFPGWEKLVAYLISDQNINKIFRKFDLEKPLQINQYGSGTYFKEDHGTTHLNVIDSEDMIALITSTINLEFGSKLLDPETGIIFNNHIDDFYIPSIDSNENKTKMRQNEIHGGKRPMSSAAPTILIKDDEIIAIGAAGGTRIPAAIISTIAYLFAGNTLENAISLCRMHNQLDPSKTYIESNLPDYIVKKLVEMGHNIEISDLNSSFTSVQAIQVLIGENNKKIFAVSDTRKNGISVGT